MDLDLDQLAQAVLRLPIDARAELATRLLESLDATEEELAADAVVAAWEEEVDRREAEYDANPSVGIPATQVFERLEADLAARRATRGDEG